VNAVAQSTFAGELTVIFSHQLLIAVDTEKGMKDKRMVNIPCDVGIDMQYDHEKVSIFLTHSQWEGSFLFLWLSQLLDKQGTGFYLGAAIIKLRLPYFNKECLKCI
jgi:hypothetical protein